VGFQRRVEDSGNIGHVVLDFVDAVVDHSS
jgi:hypothetical protein